MSPAPLTLAIGLAALVGCGGDAAMTPDTPIDTRDDVTEHVTSADTVSELDIGDEDTHDVDTSDARDASDVDTRDVADDTAMDTADPDTGPDIDTVIDADEGDADIEDVVVAPAEWDPRPVARACAADAEAPLLDAVLAQAGLDRTTFGYTADDFARAIKYYVSGLLDDPFLLRWQRQTLSDPARAPCVGDDLAVGLDPIVAAPHAVAGAIRHAALALDLWPGEPVVRVAPPTDLISALGEVCDAVNVSCTPTIPAAVPASLAADLAPIVSAIADGLRAARALQAAAPSALTARDWIERGGFGPCLFAPYNQLGDARVQAFLANRALIAPVVIAAARIAWEVQNVDWARWRGDMISADIGTTAGWIRIRGAGADTYRASNEVTLLLLDLGGDDVHEDDVGAVTNGARGVSIAIDLDGADAYGYAPVASQNDRDWLMPADDGGRYAGDASYGFASGSRHGRQGSGRLGIGMLFDLGQGDDDYRSLAMSQGYAHLGVGVLFDDGGSDHYRAEESSQGVGAYGIGLLIDRAGDDDYRVISAGQGLGAPGGAGILHDGAGDDHYLADPGRPLEDGTPTATYFSPQMPNDANNSAAQGAGIGIRGDAQGYFFSGGLGVLRDVSGDDHYACSLFCQAGAFWQGVGILADGDGADDYAALWYVQGGAAHYAIAMLLDGGSGNDRMNADAPAVNVHMGGGHDFSLGLLINEAGDDDYHFGSLAAGASNCNGIGVLVDNGGDDHYEARGTANVGFGNLGGECAADADRPLATSIGLIIDAGGVDTWTYPSVDFTPPADDTSFGHTSGAAPSEHGGGIDGGGMSGLHAY